MTAAEDTETAPHVDFTPRYHVTSERNWMNDPNGPIHWNGRYHLFYQANPVAPFWSRPHWGHVSSEDLVRWTRHPIALVPDDDGPDRDGCWSGCLRVIAGVPTIFYTGIVGHGDARQESVCRAWGDDDLLEWTKDPANPVIPGPPPALGTGCHRDPFLWRENGRWRMILGSALADGSTARGAALGYRSEDLKHWTYTGVLCADFGPGAGHLWECPQLVAIDEQTILIVSSVQEPSRSEQRLEVIAVHGDLEDGRFSEHSRHPFDNGDLFYAPAVTRDKNDRWLLWGWIREPRPPATLRLSKKVGALTLPRVLGLRDGKLSAYPAEELTALRRQSLTLKTFDHGISASGLRDQAIPQQFEVRLALRRGFGRAELTIAFTNEEPTVQISADEDHSVLTLEDLPTDAMSQPLHAPLRAGDDELELRVFLDGSIIEVFAAGCAITTRRYRVPSWFAYAVSNRDALVDAEAWQLADDAL